MGVVASSAVTGPSMTGELPRQQLSGSSSGRCMFCLLF